MLGFAPLQTPGAPGGRAREQGTRRERLVLHWLEDGGTQERPLEAGDCGGRGDTGTRLEEAQGLGSGKSVPLEMRPFRASGFVGPPIASWWRASAPSPPASPRRVEGAGTPKAGSEPHLAFLPSKPQPCWRPQYVPRRELKVCLSGAGGRQDLDAHKDRTQSGLSVGGGSLPVCRGPSHGPSQPRLGPRGCGNCWLGGGGGVVRGGLGPELATSGALCPASAWSSRCDCLPQPHPSPAKSLLQQPCHCPVPSSLRCFGGTPEKEGLQELPLLQGRALSSGSPRTQAGRGWRGGPRPGAARWAGGRRLRWGQTGSRRPEDTGERGAVDKSGRRGAAPPTQTVARSGVCRPRGPPHPPPLGVQLLLVYSEPMGAGVQGGRGCRRCRRAGSAGWRLRRCDSRPRAATGRRPPGTGRWRGRRGTARSSAVSGTRP